jgi:hypothetical protein
VALAAALFVPLLASASSADPAPGTSNVLIVHGLPLDGSGTLVDVYIEAGGAPRSGPPELSGFAFGQTVGPVAVPEGSYTVYIALAGTDTVAITQNLDIPAGLNLSAVASFIPDGGGFAPGINVFVDDLSRPADGTGRVSVRHAAAFGAVDVLVNDRFGNVGPVWLQDVVNPNQADLDVPTGQYIANIYPDGSTTKAANFWAQVQSRKLTAVYAVGDPDAGTFQLLQIKQKAVDSAPAVT